MNQPTPDDYAKFHDAYHEDTDLCIVADTLDDEHQAGYLVWLYWPRMIAAAKAAKSFGWFSTTPRQLATSVNDTVSGAAWPARARLWQLLSERGLVQLRNEPPTAASEKIDVLLVEWLKWQSMSGPERQRLLTARRKVAAGGDVPWTMTHLEDFRQPMTESRHGITETRQPMTESRQNITTLDKTREEKKEGPREPVLPASIQTAVEQVRSIPGMTSRQLEANVQKAWRIFPSLPESAVCEAIAAFEASIPEGDSIHPAKCWAKLRNCFRVAGDIVRADTGSTHSRFVPGSDEHRKQSAAALGTPGTTNGIQLLSDDAARRTIAALGKPGAA